MSLELVVESVTRENRDGGPGHGDRDPRQILPFYVTIYYKTYPDCEVIETWTEIRPPGKETRHALPFRVGLPARAPRRQLALALPRPLGRRGIPLRGSADRRHEGHQGQGRRTQYAEQLPVVHAHARRAPRRTARHGHRRHAGMERQLPYRHRQRQCPHHTHLRRHQRRPVAIHPRTERGLYDPRIRLHLQRRGQGAASAATSTAGRGCTGSTTAASSAASCSTAGKASR